MHRNPCILTLLGILQGMAVARALKTALKCGVFSATVCEAVYTMVQYQLLQYRSDTVCFIQSYSIYSYEGKKRSVHAVRTICIPGKEYAAVKPERS